MTARPMKSKCRVFRFSKGEYPTRVTMSGNSGTLRYGGQAARDTLAGRLGSARVKAMTATDTPFEWVFKEARP